MAQQKQNSEFLGGGPKFNSVGKDNTPASGLETPPVPPNRGGYWGRVAVVTGLVLALAAVLFFLNDHTLGTTAVPAGRGGQSLSPDAKPVVNPDAK